MVNIHVPKNRVPTYIKQKPKELKVDIDNSIIKVGDFTIPLSIMDKTTRQKVNKERKNLNNTINRLNLTDSYA